VQRLGERQRDIVADGDTGRVVRWRAACSVEVGRSGVDGDGQGAADDRLVTCSIAGLGNQVVAGIGQHSAGYTPVAAAIGRGTAQ